MNPFKYAQMMKYLTRVKKQKPDLPDVFPASQAPIPPIKPEVKQREAINEFIRRERQKKADGGMLVQPGFGGTRQGYAVSKTDNNKYRVTGERGGVTYSDWARENDVPIRFSNKKEAEAAQKKFYKSVPTKGSITKEAWTNEMTSLTEKFNKMVLKDFEKGNMSKTPKFATWLKSQKLKNAGVKFFETQAPSFGVINVGNKKFELADILINRANNSLKHTEWMDIQKKVSPSKAIDTNTWRSYIDRLDTKPDKANKAFDYLLDNDVQLKLPKNLSKTMAAEGSLLRKVISDITGLKSSKAIRAGLNMNDAYNKNIDQIKFANQGNLWTQGEGRTLSEILENADYRMKGNISWTSDIKLSNRANKNVFDYALRNFNYHQLNKTGEGTIQFYDKKTNKPIDWNTLPKNKNGFRVLKPNSVYFIDANDPNKTKWDMTSIDADNLKWSKGKGSSGLFDEVFQAKDIYDNLLATKVEDPRNPKNKISFGKLMSEVYQTGFDNFGNPYSVEHSDGVANNPFKNLRIASQRINSALSALNRDTTLNKFTKDGILKVLKEGTFDPNQKNVIDTIIKGTAPIREDVLVQGTKFDQSELDIAKQKFLTNLDKNKFKRVSKVLVNAAIDGGFGEAVQKICMRRKAKKGGRMFFAEGPGCPAADQDPKGFLKSVSDNPQLAKFFKSSPGQKAVSLAARVTGNILNPSTLIGGEVAFVLGDALNNYASGLDLAESFDRAFIFADFGKFEENLINKAKELGYDDNQLNLLQQTIDINKLENRRKKLEYGLDVEKQDPSGLTSDATMGFENRLVNTNKNLDNSVINYFNTLNKMGFDIDKAADQDTGFTYLDNVFKKQTQDQLLKTFDKRKRQVDPTQTPFGAFISPVFDLGSYTQPLKFAADIFNPFTKDVPFLSERQRKAKKLREMSEEELDAYNKARGFTIEDIQQGTAPQIRPVMDYLGTDVTGQGFGTQFLAGGGIAKIAGVDQGPPPESGPNSQGLPGLLKRVKNR
jgi:hypothetical protein